MVDETQTTSRCERAAARRFDPCFLQGGGTAPPLAATDHRQAAPRREGRRPRFQEGFTLLELLLVLALLAFLVAMAAPRLAGLAGTGLKTVTRTNMARLVSLITVEMQRTGKYPSGMINIVSVEGTYGDYHKPMISDQDPDTGPEVLGHRMDQRHRLRLHYLSAAEARELRRLGVLHVYNYNSPFDRDVVPGSPAMEPVRAGVAVLMTGGGASTDPGPITADLAEADRGHPDELFRMVFGLGTETSLVTRGLIHGPSTCPESGLAPINYEWKWYSLMLPRLEATARRLAADDPLGLGGQGSVTAYAATGSRTGAQLTGTARRTVATYAPQHQAFFAVMDSEGEVMPTLDMKGWGLDFDDDGDID